MGPFFEAASVLSRICRLFPSEGAILQGREVALTRKACNADGIMCS